MKIQKHLIFPLIVFACLIIGGTVLYYRMISNETFAKSTLIAISSSLKVYRGHCPAYPSKLSDLKADQGCGAFMMVTDDLLSGHVEGYDFLYEPRDSDGDGKLDFFVLRAVPTTRWLTSRKSFVIDSSGARRTE
jgi:hypothetical protein